MIQHSNKILLNPRPEASGSTIGYIMLGTMCENANQKISHEAIFFNSYFTVLLIDIHLSYFTALLIDIPNPDRERLSFCGGARG